MRLRSSILVTLGWSVALASSSIAAPADAEPTPWRRWVEVQTLQADARYRMVESSAGQRIRQLQHKQTLKGALRVDRGGRFTIQALVGTGTGFTGSWDNTGTGTGQADWNPRVRQLLAAIAPIGGVEAQIGGLGLVRGQSTEITSYDNDGYLVGGRATLQRAEQLYLDQLSITAGHLGDPTQPDVFERFDDLDDHNYTQVLLAMKFGARLATSLDWTRVAGIETWRQGLRVGIRESRVADAARVELYQRIDGTEGSGFAAALERPLTKWSSVTAGFADLDRDVGTLTGDRYGRGRRVFVEGKLDLASAWTLNVFYGRARSESYPIANRHRFDVVLSFNALKVMP
jgi:hypothetical protein